MTEESLPEAILIKQDLVNQFNEACALVGEINYQRPFGEGKINPLKEMRLSQLIQTLFMKLSMKPVMKDRDDYKTILSDIKMGKTTKFDQAFELLLIIGEMLQELGPLKIEYVRGVKPEHAVHEGDFVEQY